MIWKEKTYAYSISGNVNGYSLEHTIHHPKQIFIILIIEIKHLTHTEDLYKWSRCCQCDVDAMRYSKTLSLSISKILVNIFGGNLLICFMFCKNTSSSTPTLLWTADFFWPITDTHSPIVIFFTLLYTQQELYTETVNYGIVNLRYSQQVNQQ